MDKSIEQKKTVSAFYSELWNKHDFSQIDNILHEQISFRGSLGDEKSGRVGFMEYVDGVHSMLGDYRCDIIELVSEDNKCFARMNFSGIHKGNFFGFSPTGKRVQWAGAALFSFQDETIKSVWVLGDLHNLFPQLR